MKRLLSAILSAGSSRALAPLVIGFFFLFYIGIAFFTDETLITLMALTGRSFILAGILALIPLNCALRMLMATGRYLQLRRALAGKSADFIPDIFDETVEVPDRAPAQELEARLHSEGYTTLRTDNALAAWRGIDASPIRILFLAGFFCLFAGILISTTTRTARRQMVIEGETLTTPTGVGARVERITLARSSGPVLIRTLDIEVAPAGNGSGKKVFGLYPPSLFEGSFVYPRYLGLGLMLRFSAPDLPQGYETHSFLNCYPPGKEDSVAIPDSPYRLVLSIPEPEAGSDRYTSYMTGNVTLRFKLLKGNDSIFTGSIPAGGEFIRDGYRIVFPDIRRLVVTDFIGDYGVFFIWLAALLFGIAGCAWLPIRLFFPRREMLFRYEHVVTRAFSRAEGRARRHAGVFSEALDLIDAGRG